jgi:hypothetical protein
MDDSLLSSAKEFLPGLFGWALAVFLFFIARIGQIERTVNLAGRDFRVRSRTLLYTLAAFSFLGGSFVSFHRMRTGLAETVSTQESRIESLELEAGRPRFKINLPEVSVRYRDEDRKASFTIATEFENVGEAVAHRVHVKLGMAPNLAPETFWIFPSDELTNPILKQESFTRTTAIDQTYEIRDNGERWFPSSMLIHASVYYCDSLESDANCFDDERWFEYFTGRGFVIMSRKARSSLEPYVRRAQKAN